MVNYAIIETGSKQYRVEPKAEIQIELLGLTEPPEKKEITLDKVLLVRDGDDVKVGTPFIENAKVVCEYLGDFRGRKVITFKYRRRKNSRRIRGHRQSYHRLRVKEIISK